MKITKITIGETEYNRLYLIQFNGELINVTPLAQTDKEVKDILKDKDIITLQDDNFIALNCIGSAYASIINEEVIEKARKNAVKWFAKQVGYAKKNLEVNELRLKQAMNAKLENTEEED